MTNILFGNLLAVSRQQLLTFAALLMLLAVSIGFIYRPMLFASTNAEVAEAKGVPVRALSIIHGTARTGSDHGGPSCRYVAPLRLSRHACCDSNHADDGPEHRDAHLDDHQRGVGLVRARSVRNVPRAAELRHRVDRLYHMIDRMGSKSCPVAHQWIPFRLLAGTRNAPDPEQSATGVGHSCAAGNSRRRNLARRVTAQGVMVLRDAWSETLTM